MAKNDATKELVPSKDSRENSSNQCKIVYVLGGPGSGKSTQCSKIVEHLGFCHLSAGDLLQAEVDSGSDKGKMIQEFKKEGNLVPSEIIIRLLREAMQGSQNKKFLIDGFPRNEENLAAAENIRRADDNTETIKKRLKVYFDATLPVIDYYSSKGKIRKIDAERPVEEVFDAVKGVSSEIKERPGESKDKKTRQLI